MKKVKFVLDTKHHEEVHEFRDNVTEEEIDLYFMGFIFDHVNGHWVKVNDGKKACKIKKFML